ncbi:MAG: DUF2628 domain-containing protein, partial [Hyphomicrobiales bacterium]
APAVVPDKFSWAAAILPPVYALNHGLWLGLVLYVVAVAAIGVSSLWIGDDAAFWLYGLLAVLIGFEAAGFRRAKLRRKGWAYRSDVIAAAPDLAQRDWLLARSAAA